MRQGRAAGRACGLLALGLILSLIGLGAMAAALDGCPLLGTAFPMLGATPSLGTATIALTCDNATARRCAATPLDPGAIPLFGRGAPVRPGTRTTPLATRRIVQDTLRRQRVESGYPRDMAIIAQHYFWRGPWLDAPVIDALATASASPSNTAPPAASVVASDPGSRAAPRRVP
jgi:hypothetical protein